jgi:hypothetical protein
VARSICASDVFSPAPLTAGVRCGNVCLPPVSKSVDMKDRSRVVMGSTAAVVVLILVFWGTWSFAYHRGFDCGYAQGGREEFLRWKQDPMKVGRDWDGMITGHRNMKEPATVTVRESRPWPVNAWSAPFGATGAVSVSAGGAPTK